MNEKSIIRLSMLAGLAFVLFSSTFFIINEQEQALVTQFGEIKRIVRKPGLKAKIPFIQDTVIFDKRLLDFHAEPRELITRDSERVMVDAYARYRIVNPAKFYVAVRNEYTMRSRLSNILESSLRQEIASVTLKTVLSEDRVKLMSRIRDDVNRLVTGKDQKANPGGFGIEVVDVRIMRTDLPQENSEAVFNRMRTEREREAREFRAQGAEEALKIRADADRQRAVLLAEAKRKSETLRGEGDATAAKIYNDAVARDPKFFAFWRSMQAYKATLGANNTSLVLDPDSGFLEYLKKAP